MTASIRHLACRYMIVVLLFLLLPACGGGGGGGQDSGDTGNTGDTGNADDTGDAGGGTRLPLALTLTQGDFWEYFWTDEQTTFSQGSGSSSEIQVGRYTITLGAPVLIQGMDAFPLLIDGETGTGNAYAPRWTHLAVSDGSLLGSTDGASLRTVYDADSGNWVGGGMFADFGSQSVQVSVGQFDGVYNDLSALIARYEFENARCETILGLTLCGDSSTSYSEREYYKEGIGPLGYTQRISYSDDGGGLAFFSSVTNVTIELIGSSENATDGSQISQPPWEEISPMNQARSRASAVALGGRIYVLGGLSGTTFLDSVEVFDPSTGRWSFDDDLPGVASNAPAGVIDGKIHLINSPTEIWVYDPAAPEGQRWSVNVPVTPGDTVPRDAAVYDDQAFGFGEILVGAFHSSSRLRFRAYAPGANAWLVSDNPDLAYQEWLRFNVEVVGDVMYVLGGFGRNGLLDDRGARDRILMFDLVGDQWITTQSASMNQTRDDMASTVLNSKIYIFGGAPVGCSDINPSNCSRGSPRRSAEVFDPVTNRSSELPAMLTPREQATAIALGGQVYVIGGSNDNGELASVERLTPP